MTSDGTHSYTWDARNHLKQIDSGTTASFIYDPFGRRTSKTISSTQTGFLYDGANSVQELSGTTVTANSLVGGVDEVFQRTDSAGARSFLTDALGSSLALTDSSGTFQTTYSFDAFGNTTASGSASSNTFAYTGREADSTGLYYYRARYCNPQLQRFISEDPLGFGANSVNFYEYAYDNPTNLIDPFGLQSFGPGQALTLMQQVNNWADSLPLPGPVARDPDYTSYTATFPVYGPLGVAPNAIYSNGNWYATAQGAAGVPNFSGSVTWGWLDKSDPNPYDIENFITKWGSQGCVGFGVGVCRTWSPGNGWATEIGIFTPQAGVTGGHTFKLHGRKIATWLEREFWAM
jgi:RHS repeat-associated protein